jgi:hypothetical protein
MVGARKAPINSRTAASASTEISGEPSGKRRQSGRNIQVGSEQIVPSGSSQKMCSPWRSKTFLAKIIAWRACQANQRVLFTAAMDMLNHLLASQVDHSLVRKLRTYITLSRRFSSVINVKFPEM